MDKEQSIGFVEKINFNDLKFEEIVGKGAFGVVRRAMYHGHSVAVKLIETETEKKAFITELKQLSRVSHANIVRLYGACTEHPVCLVMEYAEGGSLYNVLHGAGPQPSYSAAHAMSWTLQCAKGVAYLHGMKPKALIHRDLKPPNLLLIMGGTVLKICDFGTACEFQTHMTNNKGSAAWMAPEVFEGCNYTEKCDVFSWGIILWEVLTRKKPFDEMGGPAFRIMWAVHNGTRPPLIRDLPKPLELLMTRCWAGNHVERPSMDEVTRIMTRLSEFFTGADQPLVFPQSDNDQSETTHQPPPVTTSSYSVTPGSTVQTCTSPHGRTGTFSDTVRVPADRPETENWNQFSSSAVISENENRSAPGSLSASRENLVDSHSRTPVSYNKRNSAEYVREETNKKMLGHRRSGSYGNPIPSVSFTHQFQKQKFYTGADLGNSHGSSSASTPRSNSPTRVLKQVKSYPESVGQSIICDFPKRSTSHPAKSDVPSMWNQPTQIAEQKTPPRNQFIALDRVNPSYMQLEHKHQPLHPCPTNQESMEIYRKHTELARHYLIIKQELDYLRRKKKELIEETEEMNQKRAKSLNDEYGQLLQEWEDLCMLKNNLQKQVQQIRQ